MLPKLLLILIFTLHHSKADLTFKNVMVTCENEDLDEEEAFVTVVTAKALKPHLPLGQSCFRIEIERSNLPTLYSGAFANIDNVDYLLLENDNIREIDAGAFDNLTVRQGISLKQNGITYIGNGVFNYVSVSLLFLNLNAISRIHPFAFDNMPELRELHLEDNRLSFIDSNWFKDTPKLHKVILGNNRIERVPMYAFRNLASKRDNDLTIDLSHNLIKAVDDRAFKKPNRFGLLSLANNQIQELKYGWLEGVEVRTLDISNNRLQCLVHDGLGGAFSTNYIDGNPWLCTCLQEIKKKQDRGVFGKIVANQGYKTCQIY